MSKKMTLRNVKIINYLKANTKYNPSKNWDKIIILISAIDADRVEINGYHIKRKDSSNLLNRDMEQFEVYTKPIKGKKSIRTDKMKIKPYMVEYYLHDENGHNWLAKKYQKAVLVEEDS